MPWKINNIQYYLVLSKLGALYFQRERFLWKCQKQSFSDVLQNMSSEKFRKFCTKIPVSQSLYNQVADPRLGLQLDYKETPTQEFSCDTCEIMKNIFFYRTPIWKQFRWLHLQLTYKLKIYSLKLQENICDGVSFVNNVSSLYHATLFKKRLRPRPFPV